MTRAGQDTAELAEMREPREDESAEYAHARTALLAEEIALQRAIDRVAELRRQLARDRRSAGITASST